MKWLCNAKNYIEAGMITGILDNEGIPHRTFALGAGMRHRSDLLLGVQIQVPACDYDEAKDLLEAYFQTPQESMDEINFE